MIAQPGYPKRSNARTPQVGHHLGSSMPAVGLGAGRALSPNRASAAACDARLALRAVLALHRWLAACNRGPDAWRTTLDIPRGFRSACPSTMASDIWPKRLTASWRNPFKILRSSSATTRRRTVPPRSAGHMRSATPVFAITAMRRTSARYPISTGSSSFPAGAFSSGQPTTICITRAI
jgi:hypothetical protein